MKNKLTLIVLLIIVAAAGVGVWKQKTNSCEAGTYLPTTVAYKWIFEKTPDGSTRVLLNTDSQDVSCANKINKNPSMDLGTYAGSCKEVTAKWVKKDSDKSDGVNLDPKTRAQCLVGDTGKEIRVYERDVELFFHIGDVNLSVSKPFSGNFKVLQSTLVK